MSETDPTRINRAKRDTPVEQLPPGVAARLEFVAGPEKGRTEAVDRPYVTLGRSSDRMIRLTDDAASGRHAAICFLHSLEWRIRDSDSTNGTLLNGSPVTDYALRDGDKIVIGDTMIVFHTVHAGNS